MWRIIQFIIIPTPSAAASQAVQRQEENWVRNRKTASDEMRGRQGELLDLRYY